MSNNETLAGGVLAELQHTIEQLHDVRTDLDVTAYIVDDALRRELPGAKEGLPEQLFVRESEGEMEIALYIAPSVVSALEQDNPRQRLHAGNLESYCIALEGVSHFVFLTWRATVGWPVSALEMEIQAEVDKFVGSWLLLGAQGQSLKQAALPLARQLFESYVLRDELDPDERDRYHTATKVAAAFCRGLAQRHGNVGGVAAIVQDARTFYRQPLAKMIRAA
jgi:hypothetical protein